MSRMSPRWLPVVALATCAVVACRQSPPPKSDSTSIILSNTPALALTSADLRSLRWIEGTWRGTGTDVPPFYERYTFVNDSTLHVESFADSTLRVPTDTSRYELRDGRFGNSGARAQWHAVQLHDGAIGFAPVRGARNTFVWRPVSSDEWAADLEGPATAAGGASTPTRKWSYQMKRWAPK